MKAKTRKARSPRGARVVSGTRRGGSAAGKRAVRKPGKRRRGGKPAPGRRSGAALLLIDVQQGFDESRWGKRNNPEAEKRIAELLAAWRAAGLPVVHVQHQSLEPGSPLRAGMPGSAFKPEALPRAGEPVFRKHVNSAFIGTDLETHLRGKGIEELVLVGLTTDHCVSTTARMAGNLGFRVVVVEDATATFERTGPDGSRHEADLVHRLALASLHGEFATVKRAHQLLDEETP